MSQNLNYNHLKNEKSAYLLQHADNPVHWYAYGPEALLAAKEQNRPVFLSIGYSSCHWCHVMAHESFESKEVADYLNENFICIKVDREEHPDIDQYYQKACLHFNGRGGWPLSAFTTPDLKPFFVGTYFPLKAREGMPSFLEVLNRVQEVYTKERSGVEAEANQIVTAVIEAPAYKQKIEFEGHFPGPQSILKAMEQYKDKEHGSYGGAPKFPLFAFYEWAVEHMLEGMIEQEEGNFILETLEKMLMGGIYDQARGGIHRYSVDARWQVPHFEKMLYDQAGLLRVISKASNIYPSPLFFDTLLQTLDYIEAEMMSEEGYFFSAQDADSEGVEGLYFAFTENEFVDAITEHSPEIQPHIELMKKWFSITKEGNFEHGLNVLALDPQYKEEMYQQEGWAKIRLVRSAIVETRKERIPPQTDNKGVASWNFMMLSALCDVIQYCRVETIRQLAFSILNKSLEGVHKQFIDISEQASDSVVPKNRIRHTTTLPFRTPYLEDYVFFCENQFRLLEITGNPIFLGNGIKTLEFIKKEFIKDGAIYTRALNYNDTEPFENLISPLHDQSYRSPSATLLGLCRKWSLASGEDLLNGLESCVELTTQFSLQNPLAHGEALRALVYPQEVYRKLEVPLSWLQNGSLTPLLAHFSSRFALIYHEREDQQWQICTLRECEIQGTGFDEFQKLFITPQENV